MTLSSLSRAHRCTCNTYMHIYIYLERYTQSSAVARAGERPKIDQRRPTPRARATPSLFLARVYVCILYIYIYIYKYIYTTRARAATYTRGGQAAAAQWAPLPLVIFSGKIEESREMTVTTHILVWSVMMHSCYWFSWKFSAVLPSGE